MDLRKSAIALFLVMSLLAGCGAGKQSSADQIVIGMSLEPLGFYPLRALDSGSYYAQTLVYEGLVRYDENLHVIPAAAYSFSVSSDQLTYTFALRNGMRFSDGAPLTIKDVIASFKLAQSQASPFKGDYECISNIEVKGTTVILHLKQRSAPLLSKLVELRILPDRLLSSPDNGRQVMSRTPIGSGAFRLVRWESGLELVFEPNPYYWGTRPSYKKLVWRIVPDKTLMAMALKAGELDVAALDAPSWRVISSGADSNSFVLEHFPGSRTLYLGFNARHNPFDNAKVRQALCLAINREEIARSVYSGFAVVPSTDVSSGNWAYNKKAMRWPFDISAARERLSQAGFKIIGHSWAPRLAFRILTIRDYQDVAQVVSDDLQKIDVPSEVEVVEYASLRQRYLVPGDFDAVVWSRSSGPDPECSLVWSSKGALNYSKLKYPRLDELLTQGRLATDISQRTKIYQEIQSILANEVPWVFLVQPELLIAHSRNIGNIKQANQNLTGLPWDNPLFNAMSWKRLQ